MPAIFQEGIVSDKTCERCGRAKHRGRCKATKAAAPEPVTIDASLEIPAGLGVRVSIEGGVLQLEQDRQEDETIYTHQITLSPSAARQVVDFIAAQVGFGS